MATLEHQSSRWRAAASPGGLIGLFLVILCIVVGVTAYLGITDRFPLFFSETVLWAVLAVSVALAALSLFLFWGYLSIGYQMDAEVLQITWGFWSVRIPMQEIRSIAPAEEVLGPGSGGWKPLWPGYYIGSGHTDAGKVEVVATLPRRRQVLISLDDGRHYAISPERPLLFMEEFARWRNTVRHPEPEAAAVANTLPAEPAQPFLDAGWTTEYSTHDIARQAAPAPSAPEPEPAREVVEPPAEPPARTRVYRSPPSSTSPLLRPILLRDPVALSLMVLGALATAIMVIYILVQYDDIPQSLTLHWNVEGLPGRVGEPREIWILPTIAGLVLLANLGLAWSIALFDRFAARLMMGATVIVHVVTWIALLMIIE